MNRAFYTPAIVVSLKSLGENNSSVTLITEKQGLVYAILYGGPKSKLKSLVSQWNSGIIYLYENPEKKQIKINDFDVKNYHSSFSQSLFKMYAASLAAELAIKTRCAGSNEQAWNLLSGFLDGLELTGEEQGKLGLIRFLWRYLELLGVQPDASFCGRCGKSFISGQFAPDTETYYNNIDNCFICEECATKEEHFFPSKISAISYLAAVSVLTPAEVRKLHIDKAGYEQIKNIVFFLIENSIETKLNSIEIGMGIL